MSSERESNMSKYNVVVSHGKRPIAALAVLAADKRHAIALAVNEVRVRKVLPPQYALFGVVR